MDLAQMQERLLGWELPSALDVCAQEGVVAHVMVTAPPNKSGHAVEAIPDTQDDELIYRVVAVRAGDSGSLLLVVSAEKW